MMFCPKCGAILRSKVGESGKRVMYCACGYTSDNLEVAKIKEDISVKDEIVVIEDEDTLPTTKVTCDKCGNDEAYYFLRQTRAGDEPETKFLKCTKCKHMWRDYS